MFEGHKVESKLGYIVFVPTRKIKNESATYIFMISKWIMGVIQILTRQTEKRWSRGQVLSLALEFFLLKSTSNMR